MAVGAVEPSLSVRVFGTSLRFPVILAPCGLVRLMHPDGAGGAAQAAASRGTISVLSTVSGASLETVASASPGPMWFQLYAAGGRKEAESLIERAAVARFEALVVTVDTPVLGHRERDVRHGIEPPLRINPLWSGASWAPGAEQAGLGLAHGTRRRSDARRRRTRSWIGDHRAVGPQGVERRIAVPVVGHRVDEGQVDRAVDREGDTHVRGRSEGGRLRC